MTDKTVSELAAELVDNGFAIFVGDGLIIERATNRYQTDGQTAPPEGYENRETLPPMVGGLGGWTVCRKIFPTALAPVPRSLDYGSGLAGKPGSKERIDAMTEFYATASDAARIIAEQSQVENVQDSEIPLAHQVTPFSLSLEQLADKLASLGLDWKDGKAVRIEQNDIVNRPRRNRKKLSE